MTSSTNFQIDILRQPAELQCAIEGFGGTGKDALSRAAALVREASHVYLTGIGASWNAALGAATLWNEQGRPIHAVEAAELFYFSSVPPGSVVIAISRSGRSIEIIQLLQKARESGATLIGITNSPESRLAQEAAVAIVIPTKLDYAISVNTYSTLALAAAALAKFDADDFEVSCQALSGALASVDKDLVSWRDALADSSWLVPKATYYFLARGPSVASCNQARLLWEEGAKSPATAMTTSGFRHGPQETVVPGMRFCIWIDPVIMRSQDLAVANDLKKLGASVALIGQDLPADSGDLVFQIPRTPSGWHFVLDMIPMQLAAERLASLSGVDCDSFRVCSYIVEDENGLLGHKGREA